LNGVCEAISSPGINLKNRDIGVLLEYIGLRPILSLNMRLGEGTGAVLAMPIIESAMCLYNEMATFASAGVSEAKL